MPITPSPGNWNIGPINLPDWGLSEKLFGPAWGNTAPANNPLVQTPAVTQRLQQATNQYGPQLPPSNQLNYALTGNIGNTPTSSGQVAGATTSSGGASDSRFQQLQKMDRNPVEENEFQQLLSSLQGNVDARQNELRTNIGSGYDQLFQNYQNLIPSYEQQRGERLGSASDIYNQIAQGLGQTRQSAIDKLGLAKQQVGQNIGNSVKDLQQNLLGVVRNTGMQLGAMGAGDTSAANVMAPYAYTKMAGQEYGKIQRQGNDQLFQIDTQTRDTENQYNQMINDVEIEKQSKFDEIKQYYGSLIANVRERMANLPAEKAQAMSGVIEGALNEARNRLATVENYAMQKQGELQSWAQNRMAQLNDAKIQLSNSANFSPQDIVWQELQARNMTNSTPQSTAYWNPEVMKKRREEMGYGA